MSFVNIDSFTSSFTTWMFFINSSCLIALARISSTVLSRIGKIRNPCLVPDLRRQAFNMNIMLSMGFVYFKTWFSRV